MSLTIKSENGEKEMELGYGSFLRLRTKVAELCNNPLLYSHYQNRQSGLVMTGGIRSHFFHEYNKKTEEIYNSGSVDSKIMDFLYAPDCNGEVNTDICKVLYELIKDYDDDITYGYHDAKFNDFKNILKECVDKNLNMIWF